MPQLTVSGPRPPNVAPAPAGWRAWSQQEWTTAPLPFPPGEPYHAVNVYDLTRAALSGTSTSSRNDILPMQLLMRLVMELKPVHAEERLPVLWEILADFLQPAAAELDSEALHGLLCSVSNLLRFQFPPAGSSGVGERVGSQQEKPAAGCRLPRLPRPGPAWLAARQAWPCSPRITLRRGWQYGSSAACSYSVPYA
jgi:hypothetical protein